MTTENMFDFLKFFLPLAGAAIAWFINERRKRSAEEYERKERRYSALVDSLQGFYVTKSPEQARQLKAQFLQELNNCWLYCPDEVIHKAYAFLSTVHTGANSTDEAKEKAVGELVLSIRQDLLSRSTVRFTQLSAKDFKHLRVN